MANVVLAWKGAVEPSATASKNTGNVVYLWKGAVEPTGGSSFIYADQGFTEGDWFRRRRILRGSLL